MRLVREGKPQNRFLTRGLMIRQKQLRAVTLKKNLGNLIMLQVLEGDWMETEFFLGLVFEVHFVMRDIPTACRQVIDFSILEQNFLVRGHYACGRKFCGQNGWFNVPPPRFRLPSGMELIRTARRGRRHIWGLKRWLYIVEVVNCRKLKLTGLGWR